MRDWHEGPLARRTPPSGPLALRGRNPIHLTFQSLLTVSILSTLLGGMAGASVLPWVGLGGLFTGVVGWMLAEPVSWRVLKRRTRRRLAEEMKQRGYTRLSGNRWGDPDGRSSLTWKPISLDTTEEVAVDLVVHRAGELPISLIFEAEQVAPSEMEVGPFKGPVVFETGDAQFDGLYTCRGDDIALRSVLTSSIRRAMEAVRDPLTINHGCLTVRVDGSPIVAGDPFERLEPLRKLARDLSAVEEPGPAQLAANLEQEQAPVARALLLKSLKAVSPEGFEVGHYTSEPWCELALSMSHPETEGRLSGLERFVQTRREAASLDYVPRLFWLAFDGAMHPRDALAERQASLLERLLTIPDLRVEVVLRLCAMRPHYDALLREALLHGSVAVTCLTATPHKGIPELIATAPRERAEPVLFRLLQVEQGTVRAEAVLALGSIGDDKTLRRLEREIEGNYTAGFDLRQALDVARKRIRASAAQAKREAASAQGGMLTIVEPVEETGGGLTLSAPDGALSADEGD
ncbi:MAG: HEAT repeat domain-containing protein [Bradymonadia bacterium]